MLNNQQIDRSPEWLNADEKNRKRKPKSIIESFDWGLKETKLLGNKYCPFVNQLQSPTY